MFSLPAELCTGYCGHHNPNMHIELISKATFDAGLSEDGHLCLCVINCDSYNHCCEFILQKEHIETVPSET